MHIFQSKKTTYYFAEGGLFVKAKEKRLVDILNRGSYMSAHVLLNLLNELRKRNKNAMLVEHFISFSQQF